MAPKLSPEAHTSMRIARRDRLRQAVVLDADEARKLFASIADFAAPVKIQIECADRLTRSFNDIDELLAYENERQSEIRAVSFESHRTPGKWATVEVENTRVRDNIAISLEGDAPDVERTSKAIDARIASMKPGYAVFTEWAAYLFPLLIVIGIWAGILLFYSIGGLSAKDKPSAADVQKTFSLPTYVAIAGLGTYYLERASRWLFPVAAFPIGQGKKRHELRSTVRTLVVLGLAVGVVASVVATWLLPK